jgi:Tol biopolymer transport system component
MRRSLLLAPVVALVVLAPTADASYPGVNGRVLYSAQPSPDTARAVFSANPDGSDARQLTPSLPADPANANDAGQASASADGRRVIYIGPGKGIFIVNADGTENHLVAPPVVGDFGQWESPQFSPDGQRITFTNDTGQGSEIWLADADGTNAEALTVPTDVYLGNERSEFSPDGRSIAFLMDAGDCVAIAQVAVDGGRVKVLFHGRGTIKRVSKGSGCRYDPQSTFDFAPDGRSLVFSGAVSGHGSTIKSSLMTLRLGKTSPLKALTPASGNPYDGTYAPDGRSIAYTGGKSRGTMRIPTHGGRAKRLNSLSITAWAPAVSP